MGLTIRQLEVFVAIANCGTMTEAALAVHLSQSACSSALSELERHLKGTVFDRLGKRLVINERGRIILTHSINILSQLNEIEHRLTCTDRDLISGDFYLAASSTIGNYVLPSILGHFLSKYPNLKPSLKVDNTERVIKAVTQLEVDIAFIEGECRHRDVEVLPWMWDELVIITAPTHRLANKSKVEVSDVIGLPWILREKGSGTRQKFEDALGVELIPFLELGNTEAIKQAVVSGIGISCVSRTAVADSLAANQLIAIGVEGLNLRREFYIVLHKNKYRTEAVRRFLKEWCGGGGQAFFPII